MGQPSSVPCTSAMQGACSPPDRDPTVAVRHLAHDASRTLQNAGKYGKDCAHLGAPFSMGVGSLDAVEYALSNEGDLGANREDETTRHRRGCTAAKTSAKPWRHPRSRKELR